MTTIHIKVNAQEIINEGRRRGDTIDKIIAAAGNTVLSDGQLIPKDYRPKCGSPRQSMRRNS
jgi:hypothetical protein